MNSFQDSNIFEFLQTPPETLTGINYICCSKVSPNSQIIIIIKCHPESNQVPIRHSCLFCSYPGLTYPKVTTRIWCSVKSKMTTICCCCLYAYNCCHFCSCCHSSMAVYIVHPTMTLQLLRVYLPVANFFRHPIWIFPRSSSSPSSLSRDHVDGLGVCSTH